jgi:CheY-like chemotaxis protein
MRHRVLVVDDYRDAVDATCLLFTRLGHECRLATSGLRGLEVADGYDPDIALLDIGLPDISGYDVARELRARYGRAIYLAALTGWGQPEDRLRAVAAGFDQHILKPATLRVLQDVIAAAERAAAVLRPRPNP